MDLIDREALGKGETSYTKLTHDELLFAIDDAPTIPAVPLDKLCEWLEVHARTPIYNMQHTAEWWKEELERWMEEQDAAD